MAYCKILYVVLLIYRTLLVFLLLAGCSCNMASYSLCYLIINANVLIFFLVWFSCCLCAFTYFPGVILGGWVMETLVICSLLSQSKHCMV